MAQVPAAVVVLALATLLFAGCAAPAADVPGGIPAPKRRHSVTRPPEPGPATSRLTVSAREGEGDLVVARVGGTAVRRSDIGDFAIRYYRDPANEILTHLIDERIIDSEAARHGIDLPPGLLEREVEAEFRERERSVKAQFGADATIGDYLRERFGVTVAEHRADLARLIRTRLLRDRVIRYFELGTDRLLVRDAVFAGEADARSAAEAARAGAELARIAREKGVRPGIELPPLVRDEISPPGLRDLLDALDEGEYSDPVEISEGDEVTWHVFRLLRRMSGRDVAWADARARIERELEERPVESFEYRQWARQMRDRYAVEVLR